MGLTYSAVSKGATDFNLHLLEITQKNMNAAFDLARHLVVKIIRLVGGNARSVRCSVLIRRYQASDSLH